MKDQNLSWSKNIPAWIIIGRFRDKTVVVKLPTQLILDTEVSDRLQDILISNV